MSPRSLIIEPVLNGFVVQADCQRVVFDSAAKLGAHITEYYTNPSKVEHDFIKNKVNDTMGPAVPQPACEDRYREARPTENIRRLEPRGPEVANQESCAPVSNR